MKNPFKKNEKASPKETLGQIVSISVDRLIPNPRQPRRTFDLNGIYALAESIRIHGILQPLAVRKIDGVPDRRVPREKDEKKIGEATAYCPDKPKDGRPAYEIIAGERRFRAARLLGMRQVPCLILSCDEKQSAEMALVEIVQRESLHPLEEAAAIASLLHLGSYSQEQMAKRMSVTPAYVANKLRLLRLGGVERDLIMTHRISERHARAIARLESEETRLSLLRRVISHGLTASQTEDMVRAMKETPEDSQQVPISTRCASVRDLRICYNTIEHAIDSIEKTGISVIRERHEDSEAVEFVIRFPKHPMMTEVVSIAEVGELGEVCST